MKAPRKRRTINVPGVGLVPVQPALPIEAPPEPKAEPPKWLGEGVHAITPQAYHADPCEEPGLSASLANTLLIATPLHAWTSSPRLNPDHEEETKTAFDLGSAAHEALTSKGRGLFVVDADDFRTKAAQEARDRARADGFVPLTAPQAGKVRRMIAALRRQLRAHGIGDVFEDAAAEDKEAAIIWKDGGVWNRCLADTLDRDNRIVYDYKTTGGLAEPTAWLKRSVDLGIDVRARHYLDGCERVFGGRWRYRFVVQEVEPPHCVCVVELNEGALWLGAKMIARAREIWRTCLDTDSWPGFSAGIVRADLPPWRERAWLERESAELAYREKTGRDVIEAALRWQAPDGMGPRLNRREGT